MAEESPAESFPSLADDATAGAQTAAAGAAQESKAGNGSANDANGSAKAGNGALSSSISAENMQQLRERCKIGVNFQPRVRRPSQPLRKSMFGNGPLWVKKLVSKKKLRVKTADGFNLDMSYIAENIIAMGFPSSGGESLYRNSWNEVYQYFESRHPNHYKFYNLCIERDYDSSKFHDRVAKFPFEDHHPPPLNLFLPFCIDMVEWLTKHKSNVAAVHCKAGKGRTGVMICAFLVYAMQLDFESAMSHYQDHRTQDAKGVTIASQKRFIKYFELLCLFARNEQTATADVSEQADNAVHGWKPAVLRRLTETPRERGQCVEAALVYLTQLRIISPPKWMGDGKTVKIVICSNYWDGPMNYKLKALDHGTEQKGVQRECKEADEAGGGRSKDLVYNIAAGIPLQAEVKVVIYKVGLMKQKKKLYYWFHSSFCSGRERLSKVEIDGSHKDSKHKKYDARFAIEMAFSDSNPKKSGAQEQMDCKIGPPRREAMEPAEHRKIIHKSKSVSALVGGTRRVDKTAEFGRSRSTPGVAAAAAASADAPLEEPLPMRVTNSAPNVLGGAAAAKAAAAQNPRVQRKRAGVATARPVPPSVSTVANPSIAIATKAVSTPMGSRRVHADDSESEDEQEEDDSDQEGAAAAEPPAAPADEKAPGDEAPVMPPAVADSK